MTITDKEIIDIINKGLLEQYITMLEDSLLIKGVALRQLKSGDWFCNCCKVVLKRRSDLNHKSNCVISKIRRRYK